MIRVLVDSRHFAAPQAPESLDEIEAYVGALRQLLIYAGNQAFRLLRSGRAWEALEEAGSRPPWGPSPLDVVVQPGDVSALFLTAMERCIALEDELGLGEVLADEIVLDRPPGLAGGHQALAQDHERLLCLWWTPCGSGNCHSSAPIVSRGLAEPYRVTLTGVIVDADPLSVLASPPPLRIEGTSPHITGLEEIGLVVPASHAFAHGSLDVALRIELSSRLSGGADLLGLTMPEYSCRDSFWATATALGFLGEPARAAQLIRACVDTLLGERLAQTHRLRVSAEGGARPLTRSSDGASAWRRDIDYEYHLHYWQTESGVELASVVTHNDMGIPE